MSNVYANVDRSGFTAAAGHDFWLPAATKPGVPSFVRQECYQSIGLYTVVKVGSKTINKIFTEHLFSLIFYKVGIIKLFYCLKPFFFVFSYSRLSFLF